MRLDAQGDLKAKAPTFCGWCSREVMWSWTWSERCVVVRTDNTYIVSACVGVSKSTSTFLCIWSKNASETCSLSL